jgi:hypothetical protein
MYHRLTSGLLQQGIGVLEDPQAIVAMSRARSTPTGSAPGSPLIVIMDVGKGVIQLCSMMVFLWGVSHLATVASLLSIPPIVWLRLRQIRVRYHFERETARVPLALNYWQATLGHRASLGDLLSNEGLDMAFQRLRDAY